MFKKILAPTIIAAALFAAVPARAEGTAFFPWGFVGFELINAGVTQGILVACHGRPDLSPDGLVKSFIPIVAPVKALQSCPKR